MKTVLRILLHITLPLLAWQCSLACSCSVPPTANNLCGTAKFYEPYHGQALVIKAIKIAQVAHGMKVRILDIAGGHSAKDTVMVWGDNGFLCRKYTNQFNLQDTLILLLFLTDFGGGSLEKQGDYMLGVCGVFDLKCVRDSVVGQSLPTSGATPVPYLEFKNSLGACITTGLEKAESSFDFFIFPNPSAGKFEVGVKEFQSVSLCVYNHLGEVVLKLDNRTVPVPVDLLQYGKGMYFIQVFSGDEIATRRVSIQ